MVNACFNLAAASPGTSGAGEWPWLEPVKALLDFLSQPALGLPLLTLVFGGMVLFYRVWTRPAIATTLLMLISGIYFGGLLVDSDYRLIVGKPDNVPITLMLFGTGLCLWIAFRQAAINDAALAAGKALPIEGKDDKVLVWPDLVYIELICMVVAMAGLFLWAIFLPAPLEAPANPAGPPNPSKAPWYFLGLQELLVYFDPWMAGVLLPAMMVTGLIGLPYLDRNPLGNGYYTFAQRRFAVTTWLFGFLILWVVLIAMGTFLRGPNWNFFGPFAHWDPHRVVPLTNINFSQLFWNEWLGMPQPRNLIWREGLGIVLVLGWLVGVPMLLARTLARSVRLQLGLARFYFLAFHLAVMGLVPMKMVLRWTIHLKYFIALPEFNLNL